MIHLPKGDREIHLPIGRYTYQREIHFRIVIHLPKGDTLTKGRYTFRIVIHFSNSDTLFE